MKTLSNQDIASPITSQEVEGWYFASTERPFSGVFIGELAFRGSSLFLCPKPNGLDSVALPQNTSEHWSPMLEVLAGAIANAKTVKL